MVIQLFLFYDSCPHFRAMDFKREVAPPMDINLKGATKFLHVILVFYTILRMLLEQLE